MRDTCPEVPRVAYAIAFISRLLYRGVTAYDTCGSARPRKCCAANAAAQKIQSPFAEAFLVRPT